MQPKIKHQKKKNPVILEKCQGISQLFYNLPVSHGEEGESEKSKFSPSSKLKYKMRLALKWLMKNKIKSDIRKLALVFQAG